MNELREQINQHPSVIQMQKLSTEMFSGVITFSDPDSHKEYIFHWIFGWPSTIYQGTRSGMEVLSELVLSDRPFTYQVDETQSIPAIGETPPFSDQLEVLLDQVVAAELERQEQARIHELELSALENIPDLPPATPELSPWDGTEPLTLPSAELSPPDEPSVLELVEEEAAEDLYAVAQKHLRPDFDKEEPETPLLPEVLAVESPAPEDTAPPPSVPSSPLEGATPSTTILDYKKQPPSYTLKIIGFDTPSTFKESESPSADETLQWTKLDTAFIRLPDLLRILQEAEFTGRVKISTSSYHGSLHFSTGNLAFAILNSEVNLEFFLNHAAHSRATVDVLPGPTINPNPDLLPLMSLLT